MYSTYNTVYSTYLYIICLGLPRLSLQSHRFRHRGLGRLKECWGLSHIVNLLDPLLRSLARKFGLHSYAKVGKSIDRRMMEICKGFLTNIRVAQGSSILRGKATPFEALEVSDRR